MQIFNQIPEEIQAGCQEQLNAILSSRFLEMPKISFVEMFNRDTQFMNEYLSYAESEQAAYAYFDKTIEKHNQTVEKAKKRFKKDRGSFYFAKNTLNEMKRHKLEHEKHQQQIKDLEENRAYFESLISSDSEWKSFKIGIKKENHAILESTKTKWRAQLFFGRYTYLDIIKTYDHLSTYEKQIKFWQETLFGQVSTPELKVFSETCENNQKKIRELKQAICCSLALRLEYAIKEHDLSLDRPLDWLESTLNIKTNSTFISRAYLSINDLHKVLSILKANTLSLYQDFLTQLDKAKDGFNYLIPYKICDQNFIPNIMLPYYVKANGVSPVHSYIVLELNTLDRCFNDLNERIKKNELDSIQALIAEPGFSGLLGLSEKIESEKARIEQLKPYNITSTISYYTRIGNQYQTSVYLQKWKDILVDFDEKYKKNSAQLAKFVSQKIEKDIFKNLEYNAFDFPPETLHTFKLFIDKYGDEEDKKTIKNLYNPIEVFKRFDLIKDYISAKKIKINEDKVKALLCFAQLYWAPEKTKAIETIMALLDKEGFPNNKEEEDKFINKIIPLFSQENAKTEALAFLKDFIEKYLSKTVESSYEPAYAFILRFHPALGVLWTTEREAQMEQKYKNLCEIFSGVNKDFFDSKKVINDIQLLHTHDLNKKTTYIKGLLTFVESYVKSDKGDNNLLVQAVYLLSQYYPEKKDWVIICIEKRLKYLIKDNNWIFNEQDMTWFGQIIEVEEILIKTIDLLDTADLFENQEKIQHWLKKYGSEKAIEHYFLKKIDISLSTKNWKILKNTVAEISDWLGLAQMHRPVLTLVCTQDKLVKLYQDYFEPYHDGEWNSQYQYFTEWLSIDKTKIFTCRSRLKWFENLIENKIKLDSEKQGRNVLDLRIHRLNQAIPKVDTSLSAFYGSENLVTIIKLIRAKIARFDIDFGEERQLIIKKYLSDREIELIPEGHLANQELEIYQNFSKLWEEIVRGNLESSVAIHQLIMVDLNAIRGLTEATERVKFFERKLEQVKEQTERLYKESLYAHFYLNQPEDIVLQQIYIRIFGQKNLEILSKATGSLNEIYHHLAQLKENLAQENWLSITFDMELPSKIGALASSHHITEITNELVESVKTLDSKDRTKLMVESYVRLIQNNYATLEAKNIDEKNIKEFNQEQENTTALAKKNITDLLGKLKQCDSMSEMIDYFSKKNSFRNILITYIQTEQAEQLQSYIEIQLQSFLEGACPKEYSGYQEKWQKNYHDLKHWAGLRALADFIQEKLNKKSGIEKMQKKIMLPAEPLELLTEENQKKCFSCAVFIRHFGTIEQQQVLDDWLDDKMTEQRKMMMQFLSTPETKPFLNFVEKIVDLTGTSVQKKQQSRLVEQKRTVGIRQASLAETFNEYLLAFDKQIFSYFTEVLKCDEAAFLRLVENFKSKVNLDDIELKAIVIQLGLLQTEKPTDQTKTLLFKYKTTIAPSKNDAIKFLFALKFSAKLHEMAKTCADSNLFTPTAIKESLTQLFEQAKFKKDKTDKDGSKKTQFTECVQKSIDLIDKYFINFNQNSSQTEKFSRKTQMIKKQLS